MINQRQKELLRKDLNKQTPTKYAVTPEISHSDLISDTHFLDVWNNWTDDEKLEYVRYLERDTSKRSGRIMIFGSIIIFILIVFMIAGWSS